MTKSSDSYTREQYMSAVDLVRIAHVLSKSKIGINAVGKEDWCSQFALRFQAALKKLRWRAVNDERFGSLPQTLYDLSLTDAWGAVREAEKLISTFTYEQPA